MTAPRKRRVDEITTLSEPQLSETQRKHFEQGVDEFNRGEFHPAHESWEEAWREMDSDAEIFLRALVQFAAAHYCLQVNRIDCAERNFKKSEEKLRLAPMRFMGFNIPAMLDFISQYGRTADMSLRFKIERFKIDLQP
jgi:hypothetical protein